MARGPETKKLWNRAFCHEIVVKDKVARFTYQEPLEAFLRSRGSEVKLHAIAEGVELRYELFGETFG